MNYWVVSPNVTRERDEEEAWKTAILENEVVIMGWGKEDRLGRVFIEDVQIGDIILVAQGANWQKRLFLAGQVSTEARNEHLPNTPRSAWQRQLVNCVTADELNSLRFDFEDSAFGNASQIPAIYRLKPEENQKDKVIAQMLLFILNKKSEMTELQENIKLLKYKKQIILQGPPGTGKTRKAKEIAERLIIPQKIQDDHITSFLKVGDKIKSGKDYTSYLITGFGDGKLMLQNQSGNPLSINYSEITKAFENRTWETEPLTNGNQSASAGIAKFIFKQYLSLPTSSIGHPKIKRTAPIGFSVLQFCQAT